MASELNETRPITIWDGPYNPRDFAKGKAGLCGALWTDNYGRSRQQHNTDFRGIDEGINPVNLNLASLEWQNYFSSATEPSTAFPYNREGESAWIPSQNKLIPHRSDLNSGNKKPHFFYYLPLKTGASFPGGDAQPLFAVAQKFTTAGASISQIFGRDLVAPWDIYNVPFDNVLTSMSTNQTTYFNSLNPAYPGTVNYPNLNKWWSISIGWKSVVAGAAVTGREIKIIIVRGLTSDNYASWLPAFTTGSNSIYPISFYQYADDGEFHLLDRFQMPIGQVDTVSTVPYQSGNTQQHNGNDNVQWLHESIPF